MEHNVFLSPICYACSLLSGTGNVTPAPIFCLVTVIFFKKHWKKIIDTEIHKDLTPRSQPKTIRQYFKQTS